MQGMHEWWRALDGWMDGWMDGCGGVGCYGQWLRVGHSARVLPPLGMPFCAGWTELWCRVQDDAGRVYWWNVTTNETTWTRPVKVIATRGVAAGACTTLYRTAPATSTTHPAHATSPTHPAHATSTNRAAHATCKAHCRPRSQDMCRRSPMETVRVLSHLSPPPSTSREEEPPQEALRNSLPGAQLSALRAPPIPRRSEPQSSPPCTHQV